MDCELLGSMCGWLHLSIYKIDNTVSALQRYQTKMYVEQFSYVFNQLFIITRNYLLQIYASCK